MRKRSGRSIDEAEAVANLQHPDSWSLITSYRLNKEAIAGEVLADIADERTDVVVLTADLKYSNRLADFADRHPDRFYQIGIAEQNMLSIAAGMAAAGLTPYAGSFAAYVALLGAEQIRTDIAYPGLNVRLLAHHSGFTLGFYGSSHHAMEDLAFMRTIAGMTVVCPADAASIRSLLSNTVDYKGPIYIRLGRGREPQVYKSPPALEVGRAIRLLDGNDLTIIATGTMVHPSLRAAERLKSEGVHVSVLDMHTISPIDARAILQAAEQTGRILTVEEHNITGGLGSAVAEVLADSGVVCKLKRHGVPDEYVPVGPPLALYHHYRLDDEGIYDVALGTL
jgi:transketolase